MMLLHELLSRFNRKVWGPRKRQRGFLLNPFRFGGAGGGSAPPFANVSCLLHFDGTDGAATFTDSGPLAANFSTITTGGTTVSTTQSKFGGASAATTNSTRINSPSSSNWAVGQVFTCELWIYPTSHQAKWFINNSLNQFQFGYQNSTSWGVAENGVAWRLTTTSLPTLNAWNHVAVSRNSSNVMKLFLNGTEVASGTVTQAFTGSGTASIFEMAGYCDELRLTKGVCRYTGTFTAPTAAFPDSIGGGDSDFASVVLLVHADGANGTYKFTDKSSLANVLVQPPAYLDTSQSKFGSASMLALSSGQFTSVYKATSSAFDFGTGDFTIEFWFRHTNTPNASARLFCTRDGDTFQGIAMTIATSGQPSTMLGLSISSNGTSFDIRSNTTVANVTTNTWNHIALCRSGTTFRMFLDGTQVDSFTSSSGIYYNSGDRIVIGGNSVSPDRSCNGFIDDLRVVKGFACYTANFTPPTAAHPDF